MFLWLLLSAANFIVFLSHSLSNNPSLKYTVLEEVKIGTLIGQVIQNAMLEREVSGVSNCQLFDMSSNKQSVDLIRVNSSTCELFVNSRIDREQLCEAIKCVLQLSVFIGAKIWVSVALEIIDINDNPPKFDSQSIVARFEENSITGHFMDIPLASDADIGQNSVLSYSLKPVLDSFELEHSAKNTLRLVLRGKINYEERSDRQFYTQVLACDHGSPQLCGKLNLNIQVLDINDNRPIFTTCNDSVNVMEDYAINQEVYQVTAYDLDDGENGRISFEISSIPENKMASQYFSVIKSTGKIILSKSLHSKGTPERFSITISARDQGAISLVSDCRITLNIIDVNNHSPSIAFKSTLGKCFQINENVAEVTTVALVMATDEDKNNNGKVICELRNTSFPVILERWSIESSTYKLSITKPMDREVVHFVNISVICSDYGNPPKKSEKNLSITIIDVNEFVPKLIINPMKIDIAEDLPINTTIAKLHTSDQDADANLTVKLLLDNDSSFAINSINNLILRKNLDRELRPFYHLIVIVIDNGPPIFRTTTVTLTINVLDVNDHEPSLQEPRSFHLLENLIGSSSKIGQLKSFDPDLGKNGSVQFKLLSATSLDKRVINDSFSISEKEGIIFSHLPIDREMTPEIILKVLLKDQGTPFLVKEEKVHITIADENDNKPIWQFPSPENCNINLSVVSSSSRFNERHILIATMRVLDPDSPENANITFKLLSASKNKLPVNLFTLEPTTGHLMRIGAITEGIYVLKMQASDNGRQPLLSDVATLYLTAHLPNTGFFFNNETDRLSLTLIVALASVTCIICISLLVAIIVVRRHRYSSIQFSSNGHANDHNSLVNDSLTKWTEEQNQYLDSWNYPPHYYSFPVIPTLQKLSSIGEPLLPPPGPKDVLSNVNNQQHICPVMHLRRPTNQDLDVSSADSGRGASEEETMLTEAKNRESVRTRNKMYTAMPPISSVCACQDTMNMCGSCANNINGTFHYQYVTYSPTSYQTLDDTRNIKFHTSRPSLEQSTKTYHTLDTMVTATSMGSQTGFVPMESITQQKSPKDMSSFLGPHSNV